MRCYDQLGDCEARCSGSCSPDPHVRGAFCCGAAEDDGEDIFSWLLGGCVAAIVIAAVVGLCACCCCRRKRRQAASGAQPRQQVVYVQRTQPVPLAPAYPVIPAQQAPDPQAAWASVAQIDHIDLPPQ